MLYEVITKKTAERLVIEMRDRLKGWGEGALFTPYTDAAPLDTPSGSNNEDEAVAALIALGYKPAQASQVVSKVAKPEMSVENLIRDALRSLV